MSKKSMMIVGVILLVLAMTVGELAQEAKVALWIDGASVQTDVAPFILEGRIMVPAGVIAKSFGADITENTKIPIALL